ncbi:MAG: oligosaccharide repeat unit polymerase, partial [Proteobacteria bacterium]|nr:oligosaccharide repeat unit polymerase [Pseudomonadota bacterium]
CLIVVVVIIASSFRRGVDVLSPGRVFSLAWAVSFGLAELKLSMFQHQWSAYGWLILLLGVGAFLLGIFVVFVYYLGTPVLAISQIRHRLQRDVRSSVNPSTFFNVIVILFILYAIAYAVEVAVMGNVPLFASNPEKARVSFGMFGIHLFVTSMLTIMIFSVEYVLFMPRDRSRRVAVVLIFLVTALSFFLLLQRYSFATWALLALGLAYYGSRRVRMRNLLIAFAVIVTLLIVIQNLRTVLYVEQYVYVVSKMKYAREYAVFTEPYMYFVMNLENVARGVEKLEHFYYGYFTFDWLVALTGLKHWIGEYFAIDRLPFLNSGFNTFAFQWWSYYDFGPGGVAVISLLLGMGIGFAYSRLRTNPTIGSLYLYAIGFVFVATSFRENLFTRLDIVSNLGLIWFVHRYLLSKRSVRGGMSLQEVSQE